MMKAELMNASSPAAIAALTTPEEMVVVTKEWARLRGFLDAQRLNRQQALQTLRKTVGNA